MGSRSRLPVPHSEFELGPIASTSLLPMSSSLKRKAVNDEDQDYPPRKLPAISESGSQLPLRPSKTATNLNSNSTTKPFKSALTIPKAPPLSTTNLRRSNRATSAPPKPYVAPSRPGISANRPIAGRQPPGRVVSVQGRPEDKRFQDLQSQVSSIESARAADAARLAADMEAERSKVSELQTNHLTLSRELAAAKTQELTQRKELINFTEEIENLKRKHAREIVDFEMDVRQRDRKVRDIEEELHVCREDLMRERNGCSVLKSTISEQSTAHATLNAQLAAVRSQLAACQAATNTNVSSASHYRLQWETAQKRVEYLENEVQEAEMVRRRLHNLVLELKGNIRVFARVRPLLPSDASSENPAEAMALVEYPDKHDHKEIVLSSMSESATGQERKETWQFSFDRVGVPLIALREFSEPFDRSLNHHLHK